MKRNKINTKRKIYGGKQYYVYYDAKGKRVAWGRVSGSNLRTIQEADEYYQKAKTFKRGEFKYRYVKSEVRKQNAIVNKEGLYQGKTLRQPKLRSQYVVEGYVNKKYVVGRSQIVGSLFAQDSEQARQSAWNNFYARINIEVLGKDVSDKKEGLAFFTSGKADIKNLKEGWVVYRPIKQKRLSDL